MSVGTFLDKVAMPIPGDNPAGIDLRRDEATGGKKLFGQIKDSANAARRIERESEKGTENSETKQPFQRSESLPYWVIAYDLSKDVLATRCKDLEIAGFMIEAAVRVEGFQGLAESFQATQILVEKFWDKLFPLPDDDDEDEFAQPAGDAATLTPAALVAARVLPLSRLNGIDSDGLLAGPLTWVDITETTNAGVFCLWQYRQALDLEKLEPAERDKRTNSGAVSKVQFDSAVRDSSIPFYQKLLKDLEACVNGFKALNKAIADKCVKGGLGTSAAPSSSTVQKALEDCLQTIRFITKDKIPQPVAPPPDQPAGGGPSAGPDQKSTAANGMQTREDGFRVLENVAAFFTRIEPQSLLPAQLRKLIRQGRLSPAEYFAEIIEDPKVREQLLKNSGLETKGDSKKAPDPEAKK